MFLTALFLSAAFCIGSGTACTDETLCVIQEQALAPLFAPCPTPFVADESEPECSVFLIGRTGGISRFRGWQFDGGGRIVGPGEGFAILQLPHERHYPEAFRACVCLFSAAYPGYVQWEAGDPCEGVS